MLLHSLFPVTFVLTVAASAATAPARSSHSRQIKECLANVPANTTALHLDEKGLELKVVPCPALQPLTVPRNATTISKPGGLSRRSSLECSKPAECQCGKQCSGGCASTGDPVPNQIDCLQLAAQLLTVTRPSNFFIESGNVATATMGTCTFAALNLLTSEVEYCIDDFANAAFELSALCILANQDAGVCEPSTGAIAVEFLASTA